jgi:opacity protein-like surface antigen
MASQSIKVIMRKGILLGLILVACFYESNAQYGGGYGGGYGGRGMGYRRQRVQEMTNFKPSLDVSIGYGFPNLDKYLLSDFYNYYQGSGTQSGPIIANVDYHFNPRMAIGVMVNYGKVSRPYYSYNTGDQAATGSLTNTAVLLSFTRYLGMSQKIMPYTRTAIGINTGQAKYTAMDGSKWANTDDATTLAYQVGLGVKFNVTDHGGFFVEAGYGKYIISGGLALKF